MKGIGIVAPLPAEARSWTARLPEPGAVLELACGALLCRSGVGPRRAARAAETLAERGARALFSFGIAGGLDPKLRPGELVLPLRVLEAGGGSYLVSRQLRDRLAGVLPSSVPAEALFQADEMLVRAADKRSAFETTGAAAVDLESAAVAEVAQSRGLPFACLRGICDPAELDLPPLVREAVDPEGRPRPWKAVRSLARRPRQLRDLVRLQAFFRRAREALRRAAGALAEAPLEVES